MPAGGGQVVGRSPELGTPFPKGPTVPPQNPKGSKAGRGPGASEVPAAAVFVRGSADEGVGG